MIYKHLYLVFLIPSVIFLPRASGDIVTLNNGDRISGTVNTLTDGKLSVQTDYAGTITIQMEAVSSIETDAPRALALNKDYILEGAFQVKDGIPGLSANGDWKPLKTAEITALAENIEALDSLLTPKPPKRWSGTVEAGLALRSGNTDTTDVKFASSVTRTKDRNTLKIGLAASYGAADGAINTRRYAGDFRWQYYLRERLYMLVLGLAERDDGRKLDLRLQGGGGLGYDFIKREKTKLAADIGLAYTHERWAPFTPWEGDRLRNEKRLIAYNRLYAAITGLGDNGGLTRERIESFQKLIADVRNPLREYATRTEDYINLRVGVNFSQTIFKTSKLTEELVMMPNLEQLGEFRALSELVFSTPIIEALSMRTSLRTEDDSLARGKNVALWDHTLMTQLRYTF